MIDKCNNFLAQDVHERNEKVKVGSEKSKDDTITIPACKISDLYDSVIRIQKIEKKSNSTTQSSTVIQRLVQNNKPIIKLKKVSR